MTPLALADQPHHDGSPRYTGSQTPVLGEEVTVRLLVPRASGFTRALVRMTLDAEASFVEMEAMSQNEDAIWYAAAIPMHNPRMHYRFALEGGPLHYAWLNGAGLWFREVPDAADFRLSVDRPPPAWTRDAVVYQIFPDRFAASRERPAPEWAIPVAWDDPMDLSSSATISGQLYGGDLDGITAHLDHIESLGADVVYLTPFFPARSNHRYDASTFASVDPMLGGDEALHRLIAAAHARGMRVIGDFTTNHTGSAHEWFEAAQRDPASAERELYVYDAAGEYVGWLGVPSLPKLNWRSDLLRERIVDDPEGVVRKWLSAGLDGWRIDVANMTGRYADSDRNHEVARWIREAMIEVNPESLVVGEHTHDFTVDLPGDGWHGVMNYSGFTRPVWTWLREHDREAGFLGAPVIVPELPAELVVDTIRDFTARVGWPWLCASWNLVGSHDTTRVRTMVGTDVRKVEVAAGMLFTFPSTPMLTYGDEIGMEGSFGEDGRRPMPWSEEDWDLDLLQAYRDLIATRRGSIALREGGLRWLHAEGDAIIFLREHPEQTALVHLARAAHGPVPLPRAALREVATARTEYGAAPLVADDEVTFSAPGPGVSILTWPTTPIGS